MTSPTTQQQRQCEVLGELFSGPTGVASVGRMLRGTDTGRLVFLRAVPHISLAEIKSAVYTARCVAHASLLKVIGRVETPDTIYVASEYISGVSLMELLDNAMSRQQRIETSIAVRIIHDALRAAAHAKQLLRENTGSVIRRSIFPDTVWVADYGETLLTEVGLAGLLHEGTAQSGETPISVQEEEIDDDVAAAGAELLKLLTNQPLEEAEMTLPIAGELASVVARAVNPIASNRFRTASEMADALASLPADSFADEAAVGRAVRTLMASFMAVRHPRRLMSIAAPVNPAAGEATCVFRDSAAEIDPGVLRDFVAAPSPVPKLSSRPPKQQNLIDSSHPAYAFLVKHGLLDHAQGLVAAHDESDDNTLVMKERKSRRPSLPAGDVQTDPTEIVIGARPASPAAALREPAWVGGALDASLDQNYLAHLRYRGKVRRQVLAGSVVLLLLLMVAIQLLT